MSTPRLILRTCRADLTSHDGFQWPAAGKVTALDWDPQPKCGGGLHGLLNGQGDASLLDWSEDAVWIVAKPGRLLVELSGKVKCKTATVIYSGDHAGALAALRAAGITDPLPGEMATAGYHGQATAGYRGQATAGHYGQATAGYYGQATAGSRGQATAGERGIICISRHDGQRWRLVVGYIGENGLRPDTPYQLDDVGNFVEVSK